MPDDETLKPRFFLFPLDQLPGEIRGYIPRGTPAIESAVRAFNDLRDYANATRVAVSVMSSVFYSASLRSKEFAYLLHHDRLPGSLRTSRLRKKQKTMVKRWYRNWLQQRTKNEEQRTRF